MARRFPILVFLMSLGLLAGCGGKGDAVEETASAPAASLAVSVARVQPREIRRSVLASGPVSAWEEMQLGVELNGLRVTALHVDVGQQVRRGQLLLELDHRLLDSDLAQAKASYGVAQANLARAETLAKDKLISQSQVDELRAQAVAARTGRDAAQLRRDFAELRAPDAGTISKRLVQPGQVVAAGTELLRMIRQGRLEWRAELPGIDLAKVKPDDTIRLSTRDGVAVEGRVRAVSPGVDAETRTGTVYVDLPEPRGLQPGMFLQGRIDTGLARALTVPTTAVVQRDGHPNVFTVDEDGVAHRVRIRTGESRDGRVEVLEGLKAGDAVVDAGAGFLGDGDRVRVVESARDAAQ